MSEQKDTRVIDTLYEISKIAAEAHDLPSLWEPLMKTVVKALNVDAGTFMTMEGDRLIRRIAIGMPETVMHELPLSARDGGVSWSVVNSKKPAVISDLSTSHIASKILAKGGFHSLVTVPMIAHDQIIGVVSVFTFAKRDFSPEDISFMSSVANQAAIAIVSIRSTELLADNRKKMQELSALNELSKSISTVFNFEETLTSILALIVKMLRGDYGVITIFSHQTKLLSAVGPAYKLTPQQIADFRMRSDEGITGRAFCKGVPQLNNVLDEATTKVLTRAGITDVKSVIAAPLKVKSQTLGVIHVFSKKENNFLDDDLRLFAILSSQAAVVVNSSYMYQEIEEERKKDSALLSSIGEGVLAVDKDKKIILLNSEGETLTGYLEEEVIGKTAEELLAFADKDQTPLKPEKMPVDLVLRDGKPVTLGEVYLKKRHGQSFPAWVSSAAIRDADEKVIGAIVVFRDITRELDVEQMKRELVSIATHELRTPITGIKGYLDMIMQGDTGPVNADTKETIEEVVKINQRLADLVDDLLNVGRIEDGRIDVRPVAMDIGKLATEVIGELQIQAKDKKLELIDPKKTGVQIKADPVRVRQVLTNLIGNAIKYTPSGKVEVDFEEKPTEIFCHIKDTGLGISPEEQKKLFIKFYRIKNEKTRQITGTGLGLWITKSLIEMMGGKIHLASVEGKGSDFCFSLPRA
jgi:PAS domain S-box-containing protein